MGMECELSLDITRITPKESLVKMNRNLTKLKSGVSHLDTLLRARGREIEMSRRAGPHSQA
jgi:hypothetical protein